MEEFLTLLSIALVITPIFGIAATAYLWRLYLSDPARPRSWVLFLLAVGATTVSLAGIALAFLALVRLSGVMLGLVGVIILAVVLLVLEWIPIWYALNVYRRGKTLDRPTETGTSSEDSSDISSVKL